MAFGRSSGIRALLIFMLACGGPDAKPVFGPPTEAECPPGGTSLTYNNFARAFMESYCTQCHHQDLVGTARMGAPSFHDFDSMNGIEPEPIQEHIDETSAAGPAAINRGMPPNGFPQPSDEERFMLGEWLACGIPE
jgi:hypothetical protein